jgi:hypothetical protein
MPFRQHQPVVAGMLYQLAAGLHQPQLQVNTIYINGGKKPLGGPQLVVCGPPESDVPAD